MTNETSTTSTTVYPEMFEVGANLYIDFGHTGPFSVYVCGEQVALTEKAVQLKLDDGSRVWLPKKALVRVGKTERNVKLARWFKANDYVSAVLTRNKTAISVSLH